MTNDIRETLADVSPDAMTLDGFDEALVGIVHRFGQMPLAAYDRTKIIEILMRDGIGYQEATEYYEFNMIGAWVGEGTPVFIDLMDQNISRNPQTLWPSPPR